MTLIVTKICNIVLMQKVGSNNIKATKITQRKCGPESFTVGVANLSLISMSFIMC